MSGFEMLVAGLALLIGYGAVSQLMTKLGKRSEPPRASTDFAAPPAQSGPAWHQVLGVGAGASGDEIRTAYRSLVSQYHPDKVASLGPELRALAETKTKEIAAAYDTGMRLRGPGTSAQA